MDNVVPSDFLAVNYKYRYYGYRILSLNLENVLHFQFFAESSGADGQVDNSYQHP